MSANDEARAAFPDRVRLPFAFDPEALAADLDAFPENDWTRHFVKDNYRGDWSALPLRAPAGETHRLRLIYSDPAATVFVDAPLLDRAPNLRRALARFECPLRSARLMRLGAGSAILEHGDLDLDADLGRARLHVPLTSNEDVDFHLNGRPVEMAPGSVWYLRLSDPHRAENRGAAARIHLVIDVEVNDWLRTKLREGINAARSG